MSFDPDSLPVPDLGLLCLKCGYPLGGLGEHRCPECGRAFTMDEHIPPGDFPLLIFDGKEVLASVANQALLRQAQIPFMELMTAADTLYGIGGATHHRHRLGVARTAYFEAIDLLRRHDDGELPVPDAADEADAAPAWTCGKCEEENPGNFEVCWNCGAEPQTEQ